jgi:hypothetical protein
MKSVSPNLTSETDGKREREREIRDSKWSADEKPVR